MTMSSSDGGKDSVATSQTSATTTTQATTANTTKTTTTPATNSSTNGSTKGDAPAEVDDADSNGVRKTPFREPAASVKVPEPTALTTDQETAYNSLLNAVSEWCVLTTTEGGTSKSVPLVDEEYMWLTRECLLRYLRATKWNVGNASQRLVDTLQWRRSYGITRVAQDTPPKLTPEYVGIENETGKQWILGFDNDGRPCHYLNPSRQNTPRSDRQIEHLVFMLERVTDLMPAGQETLALLMDFSGTSKGQGASIGQGRQVLNILQGHYPERLGKALLCNLPWHIWGFMKVITPFIDPVTRKKLVYDESLRAHVPPAQLASLHGGDAPFEYEHKTYFPALVALAAERRAAMVERWERGGKLVGEYEKYLRGGSARGLKNDLADHPNERGRGQPLNAASRGNSVRSKPARERSVVVIKDDEEHPLKRTTTSDSMPASHVSAASNESTKASPNGKVHTSEKNAPSTPTKVGNGEVVGSPTTMPTTVEE